MGLSKWDVSAVTNMASMFAHASAFNQDLSKWDVSAVIDMSDMFHGASAFDIILCGVAWLNTKASKKSMFTDCPGSISSQVCKTDKTGDVFSPQSKEDLQDAVSQCSGQTNEDMDENDMFR